MSETPQTPSEPADATEPDVAPDPVTTPDGATETEYDPFAPVDEPEPVPATRRATTLGISLVATLGLLAILMFVPVPYAVRAPGPTEDTLGSQDGLELIAIDGAETYPSTGELRLTTVSVSGGPGYPADALTVARGWFDKKRSVLPVEAVFDLDQSREEVDAANQAEMTSSQESATVAALTEVGYEVPATLTVVGVVPDSGSVGVLEEGDVITSIGGKKIVTYQDLADDLDATTPGADVVVGVERDGKAVEETVTTGGTDRAVLGVYLGQDFDMPIDVKIQIEDIGGPSAGTMFALGIIDKLTPEDEADGAVIAGTGTMSVDGQVGPIGGIQQKLYGAQRDGATWFLAPASNCNEVVGHVPDGLHVTAISTLADAVDAMTAIGDGATASLPTCEQALDDQAAAAQAARG